MTRLTLLLSLMLMTQYAGAQNIGGGISIEQTRVIFSSTEKAQTVTVKNTDNWAYLLQARIQKTPNDSANTPFIVTPPLSSLQADSRQLLRIMPLNAELSDKQESLFYLAITAIPASKTPVPEGQALSVGVRFLLKLFYRPAHLSGPNDKTACQLIFRQKTQGIEVANPTPYFQTLGAISLDGRSAALKPGASMVAPYSSLPLALNVRGHELTWKTINDYGGLSSSCRQMLATTTEGK